MNGNESASGKMREQAETIFHAAVSAVDPEKAVLNYLSLSEGVLMAGERSLPLKDYNRIFVVGAGKADAPMAQAVERVLGQQIGVFRKFRPSRQWRTVAVHGNQ